MSDAEEKRETVKTVLWAGLVFGIAIGVFVGLYQGNPVRGLISGVLGGVLFGGAIFIFMRSQSSGPIDMSGFEVDETILHHGPANHFKGVVSVGGKLFLTNKRLRFRAHNFNMSAHDESFALDELQSVDPRRSLGIIPNGLRVRLRDGRDERFVVMSQAKWVDLARKQLSSASTG